jgi:hypothetical protein
MSLRIRIPQVARGSRACATIISVALAAGCQPMVRPAAPTPGPPARLLDAGRLELPTDCVVSAGRIYRMSYTVGTDGRTGSLGAITPPDAPACLQAALKSWVASFRYAPLAQTQPLTTDWMLVTAPRGS